MKKNEMGLDVVHAMLIGAGTFIGVVLLELIKTMNIGMNLENSLWSCLPTALGRTACILVIWAMYHSVTRYSK